MVRGASVRGWLRRIRDHDGDAEGEGGIELWLRLGEAVGLSRDQLRSHREVLAGVRFACDAYVELVRSCSLVEAVASSLTEMFSPHIMSTRIAAWERHYPFVGPEALGYFRSRVPRAAKDGEEALAFVVREARTREAQGYPPFGRLASLIVSGGDRHSTEGFARQIARAAPLTQDVLILGPAEAPLAVVRGRHRFRLLVKSARGFDLSAYLREWLAAAPKPKKKLALEVDVDPQSFL